MHPKLQYACLPISNVTSKKAIFKHDLACCFYCPGSCFISYREKCCSESIKILHRHYAAILASLFLVIVYSCVILTCFCCLSSSPLSSVVCVGLEWHCWRVFLCFGRSQLVWTQWAGYRCGRGALSGATWPRSMQCTGGAIPGTVVILQETNYYQTAR